MEDERAMQQDIRPLNILILNLMPEKERTEAQLLRLLGNTSLQVNVTFLQTATHVSKNTSKYHLEQFYSTFSEVKHRKYDGMIITGAPVELFTFEEVDYWNELTEIMDWTKTNVTSTLHICWGHRLPCTTIMESINLSFLGNVTACSITNYMTKPSNY